MVVTAMQKSFVTMMNTISEIENHILKGLVIDEHGQWIPIADKKAVEEDFLAHLAAGQVLHEGRWVSLAEAKSAKAPTEIATTVLEMPLNESRVNGAAGGGPALVVVSAVPEDLAEVQDEREETHASTSLYPKSPQGHENIGFPPETKTILFDPPTDMAPTNSTGDPVDLLSGYAPETGAFVLEHTDGNAPAEPGDETAMVDRTTTSILLPTVSSWEQSARKRRLQVLVFGGIGVAVAGIAAIAILVFQLNR
jgi:hypothetical protein